MSLTSKQIEELRSYAADRKGELAKLINDAADTIEELNNSIKNLRIQLRTQSSAWHKTFTDGFPAEGDQVLVTDGKDFWMDESIDVSADFTPCLQWESGGDMWEKTEWAYPADLRKAQESDQGQSRWIPFTTRPLTEEEQEEHPEWDAFLDCKLPDDGQRILVSINLRGHEEVQQDEFYSDDGSYLDSGYEIGTEAVAWMPLPAPWKE